MIIIIIMSMIATNFKSHLNIVNKIFYVYKKKTTKNRNILLKIFDTLQKY